MAEMSESDVKALQEKIKNMSPEELKEFQKEQCIFCKIIAGEVQSKKVFEDDVCIAIMDINPANPGHLLLMPKDHHALMPLIPEKELGHLSMVAKALSHVMLTQLSAEGTNVFVANGIAAGQRAQHFMIHIIPRKEVDGVPMDLPQSRITKKDLDDSKQLLLSRVSGRPVAVLPKKEPEKEVEEEPEQEEKEELEDKGPEKRPDEEEEPEKEDKKHKEEVSLDDIANLFK